MKTNTEYLSNNNSYANNNVKYIVIHNTDNYSKGANAKAHAKAQHDGNFSGMSAHCYVDDGNTYYDAMPANRGAWHVGVNYGGELFGTCTNRNSYGIEGCVQSGYNYDKMFNNMVEVTKIKMKELGIDADHVVQHYDVCAKNCPSAIRAKSDWTRFKKAIGAASTETPAADGNGGTVEKYYRVRLSWANSASQTGAYKSLENAKKNCGVGYTVYDWNGKAVYSNKTTGTQATELKDLSYDDIIKKMGPLFTADQKSSGVLASVSMAQFILESGWGKSGLAQKANNCFGMKKTLSGNTWSGSTWDGSSTITMQTGEQTKNGTTYTITAEFRKYPSIEKSIADHSAYLTGAKNGSKLRYNGLKNETDPENAIQIIKNGGYATDTKYVSKIMNIINTYKLTQYDAGENTADTTKKDAGTTGTSYTVKITSSVLRIRKSPSLTAKIMGYTGTGIFTIVETSSDGNWGKLKSGAGWIYLKLDCVKATK